MPELPKRMVSASNIEGSTATQEGEVVYLSSSHVLSINSNTRLEACLLVKPECAMQAWVVGTIWDRQHPYPENV